MMKKSFLLALIAGCIITAATAQTITTEYHYVKMRPVKQTVTLTQSPGAGYVWVDEDWTWNPTTNTYDWNGGHWIKSETGKKYNKGKWKKGKGTTGYYWETSYWR